MLIDNPNAPPILIDSPHVDPFFCGKRGNRKSKGRGLRPSRGNNRVTAGYYKKVSKKKERISDG